MTNDLSYAKKQKYSKVTQALLEEQLIMRDVANFRYEAVMPDGNTVNIPREIYGTAANYTDYGTLTDTDISLTNDQLVINQTPYISRVISDIDNLEDGYNIPESTMQKDAYRIAQSIEGNFWNQYQYAGSGTGSSATVLSAANVVSTYGNVLASLENVGVNRPDLCLIVDPFSKQKIGEGAIGNTFNTSDETYKRGYRGTFQDAQLWMSSNLTSTASLNFQTNPTAGDTFTINGVTWTFRATPAVAGEIDIGADAAASLVLAVAAVNNTTGYAAGAGSATAYFEVSAVNRAKLIGMTAVNGTTELQLTSKHGYRVLSSAMTAAADDWGAVTIWNLAMAKGAIDVVFLRQIGSVIKDVPDKLVKRFVAWARYGQKVTSEGAERMYAIPITAQAAEA